MDLTAWNLPPERTGRPADAALVARRAMVDAGAAAPVVPAGVRFEAETFGGVPCVVCEPASPSVATMLYLHGGGYRVGSAAGYLTMVAPLAAECAARIVIADYRLAPEHPFPAAVHDAVRVFAALRAGADRRPVIVAGDSAGGGLAFALVAAALAAGHPLPGAVIALSPWIDLRVVHPAYSSRAATDQLFPEASAREAAALYLQGSDPAESLASPLFADLAGCPPALILAGGAESLIGDALAMATALTDAGTSVELHAVARMQHVWPLIFPDQPEAIAARAAIARFVAAASSSG